MRNIPDSTSPDAEDPAPDASTDRAARRWHLIYRAASFTAVGRLVSVACTLAQVPIALHHLGDEAFGLWITLTGAVGMLGLADFGIGLGMQNKISEASGNDDMELGRDIFLTGFALLSAIALAMFGIGILVGWHIDWATLFKIQDVEIRTQVRTSLLVIFATFCLGFPLSAAQKLASALQLGWIVATGAIAGSVISLLLISLAALLELSLIPFIAVAVLPPLLVNIGLLRHLLGRLKWRFNLVGHSGWRHTRSIFGTGTLFTIPQIAGAAIHSAPPLILASVLGAAAVVPFNLCLRVLVLIAQVQSMLISPLWPAYAEAKMRGDFPWIRQAFRRSILITVASCILPYIVIGFIGRWLILLWTQKPETLPSPELLWLLCAATMVMAFVTPGSIFLSGLGRLIGQSIYGTVTAICAVTLMIPLTRYYGASGIPIALLIAYIPISLPLTYIECAYTLRNLPRLFATKADSAKT